MSDPTPYIATIKHLCSFPTKTNINGSMYRTWSGTFGDGNVSFSLPKEGECKHGSSEFLCVFCEKLYDVKKPTIEPSKQDCLPKTGLSSNPPLSQSATSGMCSSLRPQSPSALFEPFPDVDISGGRYIQPFRISASAPARLESEVCAYCRQTIIR